MTMAHHIFIYLSGLTQLKMLSANILSWNRLIYLGITRVPLWLEQIKWEEVLGV